MGQLEPDDSRDVTGSTHTAPGEPPRTGPREDEARARAGQPRRETPEEAARGRATEGDSPEHPDRFSGAAATGEQAAEQEGGQEGPNQNGGGDRWHQQAQRADD